MLGSGGALTAEPRGLCHPDRRTPSHEELQIRVIPSGSYPPPPPMPLSPLI